MVGHPSVSIFLTMTLCLGQVTASFARRVPAFSLSFIQRYSSSRKKC